MRGPGGRLSAEALEKRRRGELGACGALAGVSRPVQLSWGTFQRRPGPWASGTERAGRGALGQAGSGSCPLWVRRNPACRPLPALRPPLGVAIATDAGFWTLSFPEPAAPREAPGPSGQPRAPMEREDGASKTEECRKILENLESTIEQFRFSPR